MTDYKNKTILLVEDEQITALMSRKVLENRGFTVIHASSGEEAVETVSNNPSIDLILMDIDLGDGIDGTRAAEIILEKHNIPLVFLSSHTEPEVVEKTEGITSYGYVVKNTGETVLLASIRMAFKLHEAYKDIQIHCEDSAAANEELEASNEELQAAMEELEAANEELIVSQAEIIARDKELSLSEKRFRSMIEGSPIPVFIQTEKKFAYLNPAALKLFGAENENQLLGTPVFDRFHPDFHDLVKERIKNLNENRLSVNNSLEQKYLRLDGSEVWVETVAEPIEYKEKHGALVFARDITERRLHSMEKKAWNDLMEYIIHHDPIAIAVLDNNLHFKYVSKRFLNDYNVLYDDIIGKHHYEVFPETPDKWRQVHKKALKGAILSSEEDFFQRPDGSIDYTSWECRPWFENDGSIGGIILYTEVITKRKLAELEAKENSENLKERIKELNCLYSVSELINMPEISYDEILQKCAEYIQNSFSFPDITTCRIKWDGLVFVSGNLNETGKRLTCDIKVNGEKRGIIEVRLLENPDSEKEIFFLKDEDKLIRTIADLIGRSVERRLTEETLKQREEDYRKLFENHTAVKLMIDPETGNIADANYAAEKFYGWSRETLKTMKIQQINTLSYDEIRAEMQNAVKGFRNFFQFRHKRADGSIRDVYVFSSIIQFAEEEYLHSIIFDITDLRKYETKLKESRDRLDSIFRVAPAGIGIVSNRILKEVNPQIHEMTGYTQEELIGQKTRMLYPSEDEYIYAGNQVYTQIKENISGYVETRWMKKDGSILNVLISITPIDREDMSKGIIFTALDITKKKQAENEIKSQLAEKEILLKEVHHRIKNNINSIESFLRLQADDIDDSSAASVIQDAVSRITGMRLIYEKLLIADNYSEISVKNYLEDLISSIINIFPDKNNIIIKHEIDDFIIDVKEIQSIGVILNELLTNVMKHAFNEKNSGRVHLNLKKHDNKVTLVINDNGVGLPPDFDLNKNMGLGLMLVKILSEQMKGNFTIKNNNGTTSIVEFKG